MEKDPEDSTSDPVSPTTPDSEVSSEQNGQELDPPIEDKPDLDKVKTNQTNRNLTSKFRILIHKKQLVIPIVVIVVLAVISIVPIFRYSVVGLFRSQRYSIEVLDNQTNQPVIGAIVTLAGKSTTTNSHGEAGLSVKVGHQSLVISKKYYATENSKVLVAIFNHGLNKYKLVATGRQVPITIDNKISGQPVSGITVKTSDSEAITGTNGQTQIVLPADKSTVQATLSGNGYNNLAATIDVVNQQVKQNTFEVVPVGSIYYLSNLNGTLDVVKTNLDGSGTKTVLAGTGYETPQNTVMLASRDWKYLILNSVRNSDGNSELNLIDTTNNDKVTSVDNGNATFSSIGWINDDFIYLVQRNGYNPWQPGAESIKSYDAQSGKITILKTTTASGTSDNDAVYEDIFSNSIEIVGEKVAYTTTWYTYPGYTSVNGQQNTLNIINPDGSSAKVVNSVDSTSDYYGSIYLYKPNELVVEDYSQNNNSSTYYIYNSDNNSYNITSDPQIINYAQSQTFPTYLQSPAGTKTFWSTAADSQYLLYIGDQDGNNQNQINGLGPYSAYGWYTDNYLIVSKNNDELYIMPVNGGTPQKVADYQQTGENFTGYGGGYGSL